MNMMNNMTATERRRVWNDEGGMRITDEALFAIEAEIILCRVKPHHPKDGLGYFLFERDEMLKLRAWDELERRRPVKERVFATIAAWGRLTERELERLYPEVDGYRIFCALGALEYEQRIRSCDHGYLVSHS